jgi:PAS domain S-box-containing protein
MAEPVGGPEGEAVSAPWDEARVEALGGALIAAANAAGIGLSLVRFEGGEPIVVYITDVGVQLLGHPREKILSRSAKAFMAPDQREQRSAQQESRLRGDPQPPSSFETMVVTADGRRVPIEVSVAQIRHQGQPLLVTFFRDISERRRSLEALQRSEARFRKLIELAPDAVWINDGRRLLYTNPGAARMLGYASTDQLLALDPREFIHPDDVRAMGERTQQMFATGEPLPPRDYRVRRSDGTWAVTEVQSIPIEWEEQRAILGFARDVTARRQMETQLIRNERLAALGTLLAGIAHEMNSPLGYVLLGVEQAFRELEAVNCPPGALSLVKEVLLDVRQGVERVAAVVRQLRASSRPEAAEREPVDLRQVLDSALRVVQNEVRHRAQLVTTFAAVPSVLGSAQRLEQVFLNLLVNATQALPEGRTGNVIRVSLGVTSDGSALVEVADNGLGIAADVMAHVFDPFFTTKGAGIGMGLGLSICHGIVTSHGGTITVESEPGAGSTFRVVLPVSAAVTAQASHPPSPAPEPARGVRPRVLVVDDDPTLASIIRRMLRDRFDIQVVNDARQALQAISAADPPHDIVLCDLMMPEMTGMDLHAAVGQRWPGRERRFLFMTGGAFTPGATQFLAEVSNPWLEKPFSIDTLQATLTTMATMASQEDRGADRGPPAAGDRGEHPSQREPGAT